MENILIHVHAQDYEQDLYFFFYSNGGKGGVGGKERTRLELLLIWSIKTW